MPRGGILLSYFCEVLGRSIGIPISIGRERWVARYVSRQHIVDDLLRQVAWTQDRSHDALLVHDDGMGDSKGGVGLEDRDIRVEGYQASMGCFFRKYSTFLTFSCLTAMNWTGLL
jgi:hypothetical protein